MNKSPVVEIKERLHIEDIASRYCELQRVNNNTFKAKHNPLREEKTSSLFFYQDTQRWYDFGTSEGGDVIDLIAKIENISLSDAIKKLNNQIFTPSFLPVKERPQPVQEAVISSEQLQSEFDRFERLDITNSKHKEELLSVVPYWLYDQAHKADLELFKAITRYDRKNQTLVVGWYKNSLLDFEIVTFKRRRLNGGKWINRKGTRPNQTAFSRIYEDLKSVYIVEGAHDALTAILLGLNFIAIPTTSYKNYKELNEQITPDDEVIFICEDIAGYKAMKELSLHINARKLSLKSFVTKRDEKMDLSDFAKEKNSIKEVLNALRCD